MEHKLSKVFFVFETVSCPFIAAAVYIKGARLADYILYFSGGGKSAHTATTSLHARTPACLKQSTFSRHEAAWQTYD